jgi:hypothetical protein
MPTYLYNIVIDMKDGDPFVIKRTREALEVFACDVDSFTFPDDIKNTQAILTKPSLLTNETVKVAALDVQNFMNYCLQDEGIIRSVALANFLWEEAIDGGSVERAVSMNPVSAIDFILQPFENQSIYIPR